MPTKTEDFTTQDIDYLHLGERSLRLRLFRPAGAGPFPLVVDLHGGAWNKNDLTACQDRDEVLARAGLAVAALDFRHAGDGYLASMEDINYGLRWLKAHGAEHGIDGARIGLCGQSSGGHLAMLSAMRPRDPRYGRIALDASPDPSVDGALDGAVRCVGMAWPVINPLSRYHHALRAREAGDPAGWVGDIPECHDRYWVTEEIMAEGSPVVALESGEPVETPPAFWVQGRPDVVHDYRDLESGLDINEPERFAQAYRKAGGEFEILYIDQASRATAASSGPLADFFRKHLS